MNRNFKLGVITDEVSQDIFEAAEFAHRHGLDSLEVRSVNGRSPFEFIDDDIADINAAADKYNLTVCAISAPLYKCDIDDDAAISKHIENFEKCAIRATQIGAKYIRGFDFWECGAPLAQRAEKYKKIAEICEKYDVFCVIESDPSVHSSTPNKLAELLGAINHHRINALFDPGNEVWVTGKASADAYDTLKPHGVVHVHIKDADLIDGKPDGVKVGSGLVDFASMFKKLVADGYSGNVMLETHYRKNSILTEEQLKRPGGAAFSDGAYDASEESIIELKKIINNIMEA